MIEIVPSILTNSPEEFRKMIEKLKDVILPYGMPLKKVQIDINDGQFLGNKTVEPVAMEGVETDLEIDFHLMTKEPIDWVEKCVRGGADRIIGQIEYMRDQIAFLGKVQEVGAKVGLALDIGTEMERLEEIVLTSLDVILLMCYPAGVGGQKFDERVLDKVKILHEIRMKEARLFSICVDGGITIDNIKSVKLAGANEVAIGKRLIVGDIEENLEKFYKACY